MENTPEPVQPVSPPPQGPTVAPPVAPPVVPPAPTAAKPRSFPVLPVAGVAVLVTLIIALMAFRTARNNPTQTVTLPTPTAEPFITASPSRSLSPVAMQPEFAEFQAAIATLSAAIAAYTANDPTLTPPVLILPLGFSR